MKDMYTVRLTNDCKKKVMETMSYDEEELVSGSPRSSSSESSGVEPEPMSITNDEEDDCVDPLLKMAFEEQQKIDLERKKNTKEEIEEEVKRCVQHELQTEVDTYCEFVKSGRWEQIVMRFPSTVQVKNQEKINWEVLFKYQDPVKIASYFDVFGWWSNEGQARWPHIAGIVLVIFGKPYHNGFQERVFSRGTFMDSKLRQRLKEDTFEMSVLEGLNADKVEKYLMVLRAKGLNNEETLKKDTYMDRYLQKKKAQEEKKLEEDDVEEETIDGDDIDAEQVIYDYDYVREMTEDGASTDESEDE
jgi:hypothetical protein